MTYRKYRSRYNVCGVERNTTKRWEGSSSKTKAIKPMQSAKAREGSDKPTPTYRGDIAESSGTVNKDDGVLEPSWG